MKSLFAELRSRLGSNLKGVLPKWHGPFQARFTHSVIPSEVEESLILTITSSKRCLDCARHDKKPIWATRPQRPDIKRPFWRDATTGHARSARYPVILCAIVHGA